MTLTKDLKNDNDVDGNDDSPSRVEPIYVLSGSQMGGTEDQAEAFCNELKEILTPSKLQELTGCKNNNNTSNITIEPTRIDLDDFLEDRKAAWTRIVIIFVSSYGIGGPPLGSKKFRNLCESIIDDPSNKEQYSDLLKGIHFALCGFGKSSYKTYFENPQIIYDTMKLMGATPIGILGKIDGCQSIEENIKDINNWKQELWKPLAKVIVEEKPLSEETLQEIQNRTNAIKY